MYDINFYQQLLASENGIQLFEHENGIQLFELCISYWSKNKI